MSSSSTGNLPTATEGIAWCSAFALEAVAIVVGNSLTIVLFAVNKNLRKRSLFLVINMAFADLFGAVTLPFYIYAVIGDAYQLWPVKPQMQIFSLIIQDVYLHASLISAALISVERVYAICWPLKHRTLSARTYRIVAFVVWTLVILIATIFVSLFYLVHRKAAIYALMTFSLILLFVVCGCNVGIWRMFQQASIASQQQNRASQNQRLTKTLLFVSIVCLICWLPFIISYSLGIIFDVSVPSAIYYAADIINYFNNSFVNPIVYALRIPKFRQALRSYCFERQTVMDNMEGNRRRDDRFMAQPTTLPADPGHLNVAYETEVMNTKL